MIYLEDLPLNTPLPCGEYVLDEATMVEFASRYDPQDFHLDAEAARSSIFGRLTASGLHSASSSRHLVLKSVLSKVRFLGSPGATIMQMRSPVWPGRRVIVTHTFESIESLTRWPGIAVVAGITRGVDAEGTPVIEIKDLNWIGSRALTSNIDMQALHRDPEASAALGPFKQIGVVAPAPHDESKFYFEHCEIGSAYASAEFFLGQSELSAYRGAFDAQHEDGSVLRNEWQGPAHNLRLMAEAFLLRTMNMGGPGIEMVRWPNPLAVGDRVRGELKIVHTRPLQSRPNVGLIKAECICSNQEGETVASYDVTTFLRRLP